VTDETMIYSKMCVIFRILTHYDS